MSRAPSFPERLADAGHGLLTGVGSASLGVARGVGVVLVGLVGGAAQCVCGRPRAGLPRLKRGLARVGQLPVDVFLMLAGRMLSAVQVLAGVETPGRRLTEDEVARLRPIFGDSLEYSRVRVKEGRLGLLSMSGRAFVMGDTVYVPRPGPPDFGLLVHELTHVWQHQHGGTAYMSAALAAQWVGDGYNWRKAVAPRAALGPQLKSPSSRPQLIEDARAGGDSFPAPPCPIPPAREVEGVDGGRAAPAG
ncbi:hypothetical protein ACLESD_35725 [Pyxidicoccus sp. 3LFB2]